MHFYINSTNKPADEIKQELENELQQVATEFEENAKIINDLEL